MNYRYKEPFAPWRKLWGRKCESIPDFMRHHPEIKKLLRAGGRCIDQDTGKIVLVEIPTKGDKPREKLLFRCAFRTSPKPADYRWLDEVAFRDAETRTLAALRG